MKKILVMMFIIIFSISFSKEKIVGIKEFDGRLRFKKEFEKIILSPSHNFAIIVGKSEIYTVFYDIFFYPTLFESKKKELKFEKATTFIGKSNLVDIYKVREDIDVVLMTAGMGKEFQVTNPRLTKKIFESDFLNSDIEIIYKITMELIISHLDKQNIYMQGVAEGRKN